MRLFFCFEYLKKWFFFHNIFKKQKKKNKTKQKNKKSGESQIKGHNYDGSPSYTNILPPPWWEPY